MTNIAGAPHDADDHPSEDWDLYDQGLETCSASDAGAFWYLLGDDGHGVWVRRWSDPSIQPDPDGVVRRYFHT